MPRLFFICIFVSALTSFASTNKQPSVSDPQALNYAAQSIAAMGSLVVNNVTLTGSVTWMAGSDTENGTATFLASSTGESRMDLALSSGTRTEIRDASTGSPRGKWIAPNGASGKFAFHNCQTDAVWFFPVLSSLAAGPDIVLSYVGRENHDGQDVQHIRAYRSFQGAPDIFQRLATMDFYLYATTLLPSAITFNNHPDNDMSRNITMEVTFSNYQPMSGMNIPLHVQQFVEGTLVLDITISNAAFNTGIALSNFAIN